MSAEDKIYENHRVLAQSKEANPLIAEQYNPESRLGPRHAAYSVWHPLQRVGRDHLCLAPRRDQPPRPDSGFVHRPYANKIPGRPELGGVTF